MQGVIDRIEEAIAVIQLREGGEIFFPLINFLKVAPREVW